MSTLADAMFEIERRVILFKSTTTLPDSTQLGWNADPNTVVNGHTPGETLIYTCPVGTRYQQDDGTQWYKKTLPNAWLLLASGGTSLAIGTINGQPKSANGAVISSSLFYMQTADATYPGLVSVSSQTWEGQKTFNKSLNLTNNFTLAAGCITKNGTQRWAHNGPDYTGVFFGIDTGNFTMTGARNSGLGYGCGMAITSGADNTLVGSFAGNYITTGSKNVGIGPYVFGAGVTGLTSNVAIGYSAMNGATSGANYNVCIGDFSGNALSSGYNVFIGFQTGRYITTGTRGVLIGANVGQTLTSAGSLVAIGPYALTNATSGDGVHIGTNASLNSTVITQIVAIGTDALRNNRTGTGSVAIGGTCAQGIDDVSTVITNCTAVGTQALRNATTPTACVAIGYNCMGGNRTGSNNVGIGQYAGNSNQSGNSNVFIGDSAGFYETGSNNLWIDNAARASLADGKLKALVYGNFASTVAAQLLQINGVLKNTAGRIRNNTYYNSAQPLSSADDIVYVDSGAALTLPAAASSEGVTFQIKIIGVVSSTISGDVNIDNAASYPLASMEAIMVTCRSSKWWITDKKISGTAPPSYETTFLVSGWSGPSGGFYTYPFTHNLNDSLVEVEVWDAGNAPIGVERLITSANIITLRVPAVPDLRFAGQIWIKTS